MSSGFWPSEKYQCPLKLPKRSFGEKGKEVRVMLPQNPSHSSISQKTLRVLGRTPRRLLKHPRDNRRPLLLRWWLVGKLHLALLTGSGCNGQLGCAWGSSSGSEGRRSLPTTAGSPSVFEELLHTHSDYLHSCHLSTGTLNFSGVAFLSWNPRLWNNLDLQSSASLQHFTETGVYSSQQTFNCQCCAFII